MYQAVQFIHREGINIDIHKPHLQRQCLRALVPQRVLVDAVHEAICHRLRRLADTTPIEVAELLSNLLYTKSLVPRYLLMPIIKSLCNAWTTKRRLGDIADCPFCEGLGGHSILHFSRCRVLREAICSVFVQPMACPWPTTRCFRSWCGFDCPPQGMATLILCHDLVQTCFYDSRRHDMSSVRAVKKAMSSRIRQVIRRAPQLQGLVR